MNASPCVDGPRPARLAGAARTTRRTEIGVGIRRIARESGTRRHVAVIARGTTGTARTKGRATRTTGRAVRITTGAAGAARTARATGAAIAATTLRLDAGPVAVASVRSIAVAIRRTGHQDRDLRLIGYVDEVQAQPWGKTKRAARKEQG